MKYPDYVKKFRPKGTVVKRIDGIYYAYHATSKRVPGKSYPVQVVSGIAGKIDEFGFHPVSSTRVEINSVIVRECGFTNYMLMFEDLYLVKRGGHTKAEARQIYRSLIVYLSPNSYLNDEKDVKILPVQELVTRYGIGIPNQITVLSGLIEGRLERIESLKYICNVRAGGKLFDSVLTEEQKRILDELEIEENEIRRH